MLVCVPGSRSYAAAQQPPGTWVFELNVLASDTSDGYFVFPDQPLTWLQLHTEKLTANVQSADSTYYRRSLTLDPSLAPPADYRSYVPWAAFRLDYDSLPPGFYLISASAEPGFATLVDGSRETLDVVGVRTVKIYVPHQPERLPQPGPGERFLYPLVEDGVTRRMNTLYGARRVWTYGTITTFCLTADYPPCENPAPNQELYVLGIYRVRGYAESMAIGDPMAGNLEQPNAFRALDPLIVALRDRRGGVDGPNGYATFSDDWDLERSYSLVSMEQSHPEWPATVRSAIMKHEPKLGMTRDMIAWMFGYPSDYGSLAQMNRLDTWIYTGRPLRMSRRITAPSSFATDALKRARRNVRLGSAAPPSVGKGPRVTYASVRRHVSEG